MRNIRYIGNSAVNKAYYSQTGIIWTPGLVDTVLDDKVAAEMLLHPDVFEDAGDSTAVPDGADNALALGDTGLTKGGLPLTSGEAAVMRSGMGSEFIRSVAAGSRKIGTLGASVTNGSSASNAGTLSYTPRISVYCNERKVAKGAQRFGYPGESASAIAGRVQTAIDANIDILILGPDFGTNLPGSAGSATDVYEHFGRHVIAVHEACKLAGVELVVCMTLPQGSGVAADVQKGIGVQNAWLAQYAAKNGIGVIDTHTPLLDQATGFLAASYYTGPDIVHPIDAGHEQIAATIGVWLEANYAALPWPVFPGLSGLVANPIMLGTVASHNLSGWETISPNSYTGTWTLVTENRIDAVDLPIGRWYKLTCDSTTGSGTFRRGSTSIVVTPGEKILIAAYAKASGDGSAAVVLWGTGSIELLVLGTLVNGAASRPFFQEFTIPAGVTSVRAAIRVTAGAGQIETAYLGAVDVIRPAAIGLL